MDKFAFLNSIGQNNSAMPLISEDLISKKAIENVLNCSNSAIYVVDFNTYELVMSNDKFHKLYGKNIENSTEKKCWSVINSGPDRPCFSCPMKKLIDEAGNILPPKTVEHYLVEKGIWVSTTYAVVKWTDGRLVQVVNITDITHSKHMESELSQLAYFDKNTGLPNLSSLEDELKKSGDVGYSLVCFDITGLTKINDVFGRNSGDALLESIRNWMIAIEGVPVSIFYRIGDDEFCILIKQTGQENMEEIYEKVWNRFEQPWNIKSEDGHPRSIFCGIAMGVITKEALEKSDNSVIAIIERTITYSKKSGYIAFYSEEMDISFREALKLEINLKNCVKNGMIGFSVFYQAITNPNTGTWCGIEALCRWNSPEFGFVPPVIFIKIAEEQGLIGTIDMWILEESVKQVKKWELDKINKFFLDVNLSPAQLIDEQLPERVMAILDKYNFPPSKLSLEITESSEFNFDNFTMAYIRKLYDMGVMMSLDDFGTGYSSFSNLKYLPVKVIKTDRSFIQDLETDDFSQHIFHTLVQLAQNVNLKVIAEGVETEDQLKLLRKIGVNFFQGYLFCKPLPAEEFGKRLHSFYSSVGVFPASTFSVIDIETMEDPLKGYALTPKLNKILNRCIHILFYSANSSESINVTLKIIGESLNLSSAYVFLHAYENIYVNKNEWHSENIFAEKDADVKQTIITEELINTFKKEGLVFTSDATMLQNGVYNFLEGKVTKAFVIIPLWKEEELIGFIGFEDCESYRDWNPEEVQMLYNYTVSVANMCIKQKLEKYVINNRTIFDMLSNHLDIIVFISDIETNKILFVNEKAKELFPKAKEGIFYWEATGMSPNCDKDITDKLLNSPKQTVLTNKYFFPELDISFEISDTLIPWYDDSIVLLHYNNEPIINLKKKVQNE